MLKLRAFPFFFFEMVGHDEHARVLSGSNVERFFFESFVGQEFVSFQDVQFFLVSDELPMSLGFEN
jgi:hypothetical protein